MKALSPSAWCMTTCAATDATPDTADRRAAPPAPAQLLTSSPVITPELGVLWAAQSPSARLLVVTESAIGALSEVADRPVATSGDEQHGGLEGRAG